MKIGICELCKQKRELIRKSHIIPDFMYDGMFDEDHTIQIVDLNNPIKAKSLPTGFYNSYVLCEHCDNIVIGQLETYARVTIFGGNLKRNLKYEYRISPSGVESIYIYGIDYKTFKLFLLSILWRASISKLHFFSTVDLGIHEDILRKMIISNDPKSEKDYRTGLVMLDTHNIFHKSILMPRVIKDENTFSYAFYINGIAYHFDIQSRIDHPICKHCFIKKTNEMEVAVLEGSIANRHFESIKGQKPE